MAGTINRGNWTEDRVISLSYSQILCRLLIRSPSHCTFGGKVIDQVRVNFDWIPLEQNAASPNLWLPNPNTLGNPLNIRHDVPWPK